MARLVNWRVQIVEVKQTKICSKCKVPKPIEDFGKLSHVIAGRRAECNECIRKSNYARMQTKKEENKMFL